MVFRLKSRAVDGGLPGAGVIQFHLYAPFVPHYYLKSSIYQLIIDALDDTDEFIY